MFKKYLDSLSAAIRSREIRDKVFFSLAILVIFRVMAATPVVGIPSDALQQLFAGSTFGETLSTVSGGVLETASVVAIGLTPYINASIIFQLLSSVIPRLEELRKEGNQGRKIISMYTRYLTLPLAILQSFVIYSTLRGFGLVGDLPTLHLVAMVATLTAGAMLMMWFGELVTEDGIGNGSSYLIMLGIISSIPSTISNNLRTADALQATWFIILMIILVAVVVFITEGERRIKVMYSRRVRGSGGGGQESYLPVRLTQFGVMPVIFAVSLLSFPQLVTQFLLSRELNDQMSNIVTTLNTFLNDSLVQNLGTFLLVVGFSFFYVTIVFNTTEFAENLQKQGAFIPGIRPGKQTADYLRKVSFRLTSIGAIFLGLLAILPNVLVSAGLVSATIISGTGLLIVVNVAMDMKRKVESMIVVRSYDRYL